MGVTWSAQRVPTAVNLCFLDLEPLLFCSSSSSIDHVKSKLLDSLSGEGDAEPTALSWLKVRRYAEVTEQEELLSVLSIYGYPLAISY